MNSIELALETLIAYRACTYLTTPGKALKSYAEALAFINRLSFVYFWPIHGTEMPSLWVATAGDRTVADAHDDPGHITWGWKDDMLRAGACYYGKILRGKATLISWNLLPYFYALSENFGDPAEDHLQRYYNGRLTFEAKSIYEAILDNGPMDTIALRKKVRMTSNASEARFTKAITDLQKFFLLAPVGITNSGGWRYAFSYDIPARSVPDLLEKTRYISESDARRIILVRYLETVGAARPQHIARLFGWSAEITQHVISAAAGSKFVSTDIHIEGQPGDWVIISSFLEQFRHISPESKPNTG